MKYNLHLYIYIFIIRMLHTLLLENFLDIVLCHTSPKRDL